MEEKIREKDMTPILLEDLGMRFTSDTKKYKARYGIYQCQYCNMEFKTKIQSVKQGYTKSCGCQSDKYKNPHGKAYHPLYNTWALMKNRCYNPKDKGYKDYGARDIIICERWLDICNFVEDMYPSYQEGLSLDRIDVNGNYCPENCRWAIREVQNRNNRHLRITNTSGFRGVSWHKKVEKWVSKIVINNKNIHLGSFQTALEAGKAYERYVRLNNLEHNFTPALTEEEIEELNKKEGKC